MTQIRVAAEGAGPATHVLIIGVGYYRHLIDGPEERDEATLGLRVLKSPPHSALALAKWVLGLDGAGGLSNGNAPVATLDLLVSSDPPAQLAMPDGTVHAIERASTDLVQEAFNRWLREVRQHKDNVGILYFCGHGITGNEPTHILLADDHGAVEGAPFRKGSFDITTTVRALQRHVEGQLYVFVDACKKYQAQLAETMGSKPGPLLEARGRTKVINSGLTFIEAAGEGTAAYGEANSVSRFTTALLMALKGYCGIPRPGGKAWDVNGRALSQALPELLALLSRETPDEPQTCAPHPYGRHDRPMHRASKPPMVKVGIEVSPERMRELGTFRMENLLRREAPPVIGGGTKGVWAAEAVRGTYFVRVLPKSAEFERLEMPEEYVEPPVYWLPVQVEERP